MTVLLTPTFLPGDEVRDPRGRHGEVRVVLPTPEPSYAVAFPGLGRYEGSARRLEVVAEEDLRATPSRAEERVLRSVQVLPGPSVEWTCSCGNDDASAGFVAVDALGAEVDPGPGWLGLWRCENQDCLRVIDVDGTIVGRLEREDVGRAWGQSGRLRAEGRTT